MATITQTERKAFLKAHFFIEVKKNERAKKLKNMDAIILILMLDAPYKKLKKNGRDGKPSFIITRRYNSYQRLLEAVKTHLLNAEKSISETETDENKKQELFEKEFKRLFKIKFITGVHKVKIEELSSCEFKLFYEEAHKCRIKNQSEDDYFGMPI